MKKYVALVALMATVSVPAIAQTMDGNMFRKTAIQADAFEIAASRLAMERSRNAGVRNFAQNMISSHSQTSQALNGGKAVYSSTGEWLGMTGTGALAGAGVGAIVAGPVGAMVGAGVGATAGSAAAAQRDVATTGSVTPMRLGVALPADKTAMLNELAATTGPQFDRLYGRYQRAAHEEALTLYRTFAQSGRDPALAGYAQSVIPHLEQHLAEARRLPGG